MPKQKKKILLVEDEYFLAEMIRLRLEAENYEVHYAANGKEGVAKAKSDPPDLIVMDYMMPEMDGVEATRQIRADPRLKKIPVLFLTALTREEQKAKAKAVGAEDYITKPFETKDLVERIRKWLDGA